MPRAAIRSRQTRTFNRGGRGGRPQSARRNPRRGACPRSGRTLWRERLSFYRRLALLAQAHHLVEDALRHFPLRGLGNLDDFVMGEDSGGIAVGVEADALAGNIIYDDCVEMFRNQLLAGVLEC